MFERSGVRAYSTAEVEKLHSWIVSHDRDRSVPVCRTLWVLDPVCQYSPSFEFTTFQSSLSSISFLWCFAYASQLSQWLWFCVEHQVLCLEYQRRAIAKSETQTLKKYQVLLLFLAFVFFPLLAPGKNEVQTIGPSFHRSSQPWPNSLTAACRKSWAVDWSQQSLRDHNSPIVSGVVLKSGIIPRYKLGNSWRLISDRP